MKNRIYTFLMCLALLPLATGCFDLDKEPEGDLFSSTAFRSVGEIEKYLNQCYETAYRGHPGVVNSGGIAFGDENSDNMIPPSVNTRLDGKTSLANAGALSYDWIRKINFLFKNIGNFEGNKDDAGFKQCIGEAYYFRAYFYFNLLVNYGGVTWVEDVLDPIESNMALPRDSRSFIADKILADLDLAIENLQPQSSSATMRIHKDVARIFKSEVALFEGTWEKYHKGTDFADPEVDDAKIDDYFTQAAAAAKAVIDDGRWSIHKAGKTPYQDLFNAVDLAGNNEVLLWKKYNIADNIGHSVTRTLNRGGGRTGASASLVDDYLTKDGKPFVGAARDEAKKVYGNELKPDVRDPRLAQTVCLPGQQIRPATGTPGEASYDDGKFVLPPLDGDSYHMNSTGYSILKYIEINPEDPQTVGGEYKSQAAAIQYRYADALLNYAEALAELGGAENADEIKSAIKPLRDRVGMPEVDFDREYNTSADYPFKDLDKYIQAVRRERRVETACEGRRLRDILRWAAADELIVGKTPKGALFTGSNLESGYGDRLKYDQETGNSLFLTGSPGDERRYIVPFEYKKVLPTGYGFNVGRDYLLPINQNIISLTDEVWTQNPGW